VRALQFWPLANTINEFWSERSLLISHLLLAAEMFSRHENAPIIFQVYSKREKMVSPELGLLTILILFCMGVCGYKK
jgi:hypothetical protein